MVVTPTGGHHIVCLAEKVCTCGDFQEHLLPCRHALTVCKEHGLDPEDYVSLIYSMESYRATYAVVWEPVSLQELPPLPSWEAVQCLAPPLQRLKGCPSKKRLRKQHKDKKAIHCSQCGSTTHN